MTLKKKLLPYFFFLLTCQASLSAVEAFDWSAVLSLTPGSGQTGGNQILHFNPSNKPYWKDEQAKDFVENHLAAAVPFTSDAEVLKYASDQVKLKGLVIELGVCTGKTINFIAALNPHQTVYGFDSFEGLPEEWVRKDKTFATGTFGFKNPNLFPPVLHNVELVKGWFSDTLKEFAKTHAREKPIAFLHIDSDLYSSAVTAFQILGPRIKVGTVIVFDELYNYPGFENHEFKAFQEFLEAFGLKVRYLAYNVFHEQVAVQIID